MIKEILFYAPFFRWIGLNENEFLFGLRRIDDIPALFCGGWNNFQSLFFGAILFHQF